MNASELSGEGESSFAGFERPASFGHRIAE